VSDKELLIPASQMDSSAINAQTRRGRLQMLFLLLACAAPVIASYLAYYVFKPEGGKTNFGTLIQPVKPVPEISAHTLDGKEVSLSSLKGQWLLVSVASAECDNACQTNLLLQRQIRASLGREKERTDWVWLITDDKPVPKELIAGLSDAVILRVSSESISQWLSAESTHGMSEHLYLIDPRGNWMMRFPPALSTEQAHLLKRDWDKLLRASVSWDKPGR